MIDWSSLKNEVLLNPRTPEAAKSKLFSAMSLLNDQKSESGHVFFATSGSSGKLKWVVLSKASILASARAVNLHLDSNHKDIWLNPLPNFHVGGIGIIARGYLSQAPVITCHFPREKWNPEYFYKLLEQSQTTLTALVPTQVFDLVSIGLKAPQSLRAVIIGGGAMSERLYFKAVELGWKLLPSYGLTECASQVATAQYGSWNLSNYPHLTPLSHVQLDISENGYLKIKSESLLTAYVEEDSDLLRDPKVDGWFTTEDMVTFNEGSIKSVSRGEQFVKIGGENVDLLRLEKVLEEEKLALQFKADAALTVLADERLGYRIYLAVTMPLNLESAIQEHMVIQDCESELLPRWVDHSQKTKDLPSASNNDSVAYVKLSSSNVIRLNDELKILIDHYHQRVFPFERISYVLSISEIPRSPLNKVLKKDLQEMINKII